MEATKRRELIRNVEEFDRPFFFFEWVKMLPLSIQEKVSEINRREKTLWKKTN